MKQGTKRRIEIKIKKVEGNLSQKGLDLSLFIIICIHKSEAGGKLTMPWLERKPIRKRKIESDRMRKRDDENHAGTRHHKTPLELDDIRRH